MIIKITSRNNKNIENNKVNILIESNDNEIEIEHLIDYIKKYGNKTENKILVTDGHKIINIEYKHILFFYSDGKNNYCKTKDKKYILRKKLYEIENIHNDFVRISKSCIVNVNHVDFFDRGITGKIIVKLDDGTEQAVSRRRVKTILDFFEERTI